MKCLYFYFTNSLFAETCENEQFEILPIKPFHLDEIERLNGDPFDRLIISQAISENLVIITKDGTIPMYNVKVLW